MDLKEFKNLKVGDWVTSYRSGIWQIYRILKFKTFDPVEQVEEEKVMIFSKRFVNNSFEQSFSEECCDPEFINKVRGTVNQKLKSFIKQNEKLFSKFDSYRPKPVDSIYNARIEIPTGKTIEEVKEQISTDRKFSEKEIDPYLSSLGFDTEELPSWTVQFISKDHECKNEWLVYYFCNVLKF